MGPAGECLDCLIVDLDAGAGAFMSSPSTIVSYISVSISCTLLPATRLWRAPNWPTLSVLRARCQPCYIPTSLVYIKSRESGVEALIDCAFLKSRKMDHSRPETSRERPCFPCILIYLEESLLADQELPSLQSHRNDGSENMEIAIIQHETELGDKELNVDRCVNHLEEAGANGADLAVLPELATTGYAAGEAFKNLAEPIPGRTTETFGAIAAKHEMYVIAGLAERGNAAGVCYNSAVLINPDGEVVGTYQKTHLPLHVHTFDSLIEEREIFSPGTELPVFETDLATIGILICQDGNYPEAFRELALKGADVIVIIYNSPTEEMLTLRSRVCAYVNNTYVALANKTGTERSRYVGERQENKETIVEFTGRSHVVDPTGEIVEMLPREETGTLHTTIDIGSVADARWKYKFLRDYRSDIYENI